MARFLLDTNIASFIMKKSNAALDHHVASVPPQDISISAITEAELRFGAERAPREARVHHILPDFMEDMTVEPWNSACAKIYGTLAATHAGLGTLLSDFDTMIAAHALALNMTLVTNDKAFRRVKGLKLEDWTKGPRPA